MTQTCLVNLFHLNPERNGGLSRVAKEISRILAGYVRTNQLRVIFAVGWRFAEAFPAWLGDEAAEVIPCLPEKGLSPLIKALQPDLLVSPLLGLELFDASDDNKTPHVVLMPDAAPFEMPGLFAVTKTELWQNFCASLHGAAKVVTLSEYSRQRLIHYTGLLPHQIMVIPLAGDGLGEPVPPPIEAGMPQTYVFYPANGLPNKRHGLLIQIMVKVWRVRPELKLVLTGWREPGFISGLAQRYHGPESQIIDLGYVTDHQLAALYRGAEVLLFTSNHEGFGMPLLEAMANGCPVICAPLTAIPEVAGEAALYVNSTNPAAWAEALLMELPERRADLIEKGLTQAGLFSWERTRQQWRQVLTEAGLCLSPLGQGYNSEITLPLSVITKELAIWSGCYAAQQAELQAKEAMIQALQQRVIAAKDEIIEELRGELTARDEVELLHHELIAKEEVIHKLEAFRRASLRYRWLLGPLRSSFSRAEQFLKNQFSPRLGALYHYPPIPLKIPSHYTCLPTPALPPVISIVTPSFNHACFLERTIQSVLSQNYPALEYIIQDGSSTDDTVLILEKYRPHLCHFEMRPDKGQAEAINLGFAHGTGEIMAYLNSDDLLLPGTLAYVAAFFTKHPEVDVVYGHRVLIDENDEEIGRWVLPPHDRKILLWADYVPQETLFWRRRIWEKTGGYIDESYRFALDWELLLRFQEAGAKFVCLPRFLGAFRVHAAQKTSAKIGEVGQQEMSHLRERYHGRYVSWQEIGQRIGPYLARSVIYHKFYRLGLLRF